MFALLASCTISWCWSQSQDCHLRLSGHTEDADTKEKLALATVTIVELQQEVVTDENGDFVFTGLCSGQYTLRITHVSCDPYEQKITLDKNLHRDFFLPHTRQALGEVVVEAKKGIPNTGIKKELSGKELDKVKGLSLSEALSKLTGVTTLQTGTNIAKPVIHGLHGNRILTINNGVRQEGQQWGNEHAPEIDPFIADNLAVIKGVDELRYGSDAVGGVILVNPKALQHEPGYRAEVNSLYFTNNQQYVISGLFEQQLKKIPAFSYRLQGTFKKAANATTPGYRLNNTAFQEENFSLTAGWKKKSYNIEAFYSRFATRVGIFTGSHIGNLTDLENAIAASRPDESFLGEKTYTIGRPYQHVVHNLFKLKSSLQTGESKWNFQFAAQHNDRDEYDVVRNSSTTRPQMMLEVLTLSEDISWDHPRWKNLQGSIGLAAMQQDNWYSGRYLIPAYQSYSWGGYWIEKWSLHKWSAQAGLRFDTKNIQTTRYALGGDTVSYDFNFSTFAASLNTAYKPDNFSSINITLSHSSRAPHINELLTDGVHHGTGIYEEGNPGLRPEKAVQISAGYSYQHPHSKWYADITVYNNIIRDFIYQQPMPDDPVLTIRGAFPKIEYRQANASLAGADIVLKYQLATPLAVTGKASLLWARNKQINDWLIGMPSHRVSGELNYQLADKGKFSETSIGLEVPVVFRQTRFPDENVHGRQDYKAPPAGYTLVHLQLSSTVQLGRIPATLGIGVRNLLNTTYRDYLNSFRYFTDEMGRDINFRIKIPISNKNKSHT